jgi:hypothetical protein
MTFFLLAGRFRATLPLVAFGLALGCGAADPNKGAATASALIRETKISHEPCDLESTTAEKVDVNGDGKPDIIHVRQNSKELCRVVDLNLDGAIDAFIYYDAEGRERRRESDFDRDGRPDEIATYAKGQLVRKDRETNFDDKLDTWDHYANDRLVRRERDSDGDGIVDQWWDFNRPNEPHCALVSLDANTDGKPDVDKATDLCADGQAAPNPPPIPPSAPDARAAATATSESSPDAGSPPEAAPAEDAAPSPEKEQP